MGTSPAVPLRWRSFPVSTLCSVAMLGVVLGCGCGVLVSVWGCASPAGGGPAVGAEREAQGSAGAVLWSIWRCSEWLFFFIIFLILIFILPDSPPEGARTGFQLPLPCEGLRLPARQHAPGCFRSWKSKLQPATSEARQYLGCLPHRLLNHC